MTIKTIKQRLNERLKKRSNKSEAPKSNNGHTIIILTIAIIIQLVDLINTAKEGCKVIEKLELNVMNKLVFELSCSKELTKEKKEDIEEPNKINSSNGTANIEVFIKLNKEGYSYREKADVRL